MMLTYRPLAQTRLDNLPKQAMASLTEYATYTLKHTAIVPALLAYTIGSRHSLRVSMHGPPATARKRPNLVTR